MKLILVCPDCVKPRDIIVARYRPDNHDSTMDYQCARDGMRYVASWNKRGKEETPAYGVLKS